MSTPTPDDLPEVDPDAPRAQPGAAPWWAGPLSGLVCGAVALCVGLLIAAIMEVDSPLNAVGSEFIDHTPKWLKIWAIDNFGTNDKLALRVGMVTTIGLLALVVGWFARRRRWIGVAAIGAFGIVGAVVASGRPAESASAAMPAVLGAIAGGALLWYTMGIVASHDGPRETPGPSRAPNGWDRRLFIAATGSAAAVAAVAAFGSRHLEDQRIADLGAQAPDTLPPLATTTTTAPAASTGSTTVSPAGTTPAGPVSTSSVIPAGATLSPDTPFITPNDDFYLIDTALSVPRISLDSWQMEIGGMVSTPLTLTYDDLLQRPQVERTITIACVSNEVGGSLIGTATWQGVLLGDLLREAGVDPAAQQVFGTSVDGWTCGFPVEVALDGRDAMIAIGMNGVALPLRHGFPARVIVPGLYGYISATKWLQRLDLTMWDGNVGYWVPRGWSRDAPVKTQSRIDVPRREESLTAGTVVVAGIAWAQRRGIAKVEVRVDDGEWQEATLATDVSIDAWRQWKYDWAATPGDHVLQVRATDNTGETQTDMVSRPDPDGATGWHTRKVSVDG